MTDAQLERIINTHRWAVSDNRTTMRRLDGWQDVFRRMHHRMAYDAELPLTWMPRVTIAAIGIPMTSGGWEWLMKIEAVVVRAEQLGLRKAGEDWTWCHGSECHLDSRRCRNEHMIEAYNVLVYGGMISFANAYRKAIAKGI